MEPSSSKVDDLSRKKAQQQKRINQLVLQSKVTQILDLSSQGITEIPNQVFGFKSASSVQHLRVLFVATNLLTAIPESIGELRHLVELHASWNQIETLPQSIGKLSQLKTLDLGWNKLRTIPADIGACVNLARLLVNDNELIEVTVT